MRKINTQYRAAPIPDRDMDWMATFDGYEPGEPIGYGATEQEAIDDLMMEIEQ